MCGRCVKWLGWYVVVFLLMGVVLLPAAAAARIETGVSKVMKLPARPLSTAASANGQMVVVLMDNGQANIYNGSGILRGTVDIGVKSPGSDIALSRDGGVLYVTDGQAKTLKMIALDYIAKLRIGKAPVRGPRDAPVTIVEFSDFQCPYCAKLDPVLKQVLAKYPREVKLVFKFFPLPFHKMAMPASKAALAAGKQKKFWEYHDELLKNYNQLSEQKLVEIAEKIGLDMKRFTRDRQDPRWVNFIRDDMREASGSQVRGTPTVFINGRRLRNRTPAAFDQAIQRELRQGKKEKPLK